ncbi:hypothetical protein K438DRAFT_1771702 [Mycena galopus ATCC 62051]|nr:hypothetical protein K438DRAFT_1771702 [Mycena galopus ATCC 62051]
MHKDTNSGQHKSKIQIPADMKFQYIDYTTKEKVNYALQKFGGVMPMWSKRDFCGFKRMHRSREVLSILIELICEGASGKRTREHHIAQPGSVRVVNGKVFNINAIEYSTHNITHLQHVPARISRPRVANMGSRKRRLELKLGDQQKIKTISINRHGTQVMGEDDQNTERDSINRKTQELDSFLILSGSCGGLDWIAVRVKNAIAIEGTPTDNSRVADGRRWNTALEAGRADGDEGRQTSEIKQLFGVRTTACPNFGQVENNLGDGPNPWIEPNYDASKIDIRELPGRGWEKKNAYIRT